MEGCDEICVDFCLDNAADFKCAVKSIAAFNFADKRQVSQAVQGLVEAAENSGLVLFFGEEGVQPVFDVARCEEEIFGLILGCVELVKGLSEKHAQKGVLDCERPLGYELWDCIFFFAKFPLLQKCVAVSLVNKYMQTDYSEIPVDFTLPGAKK